MPTSPRYTPDRPLRLAMIGTRGHHKYVLQRLPHLPQVKLVAAATGGDRIDDIATYAAANRVSFEAFGDDWLAMLDRVRPEAVVVCGPFEQHAAMCIASIDRGMHVLAEKPAAMTEDELAQLTAACARRPEVHLAGMMASRYDVGFYTAWRLIQSGAIGRVRLMNVRKSYRLGTRAPHYHHRATYGGTIPWVGSHAIDWAMWYAGDAKPRRVFASHSSRDNNGNGTMERSAAGMIEFDDELLATFSVDVFRPESALTHGDDWARIVGTHGVIEARPGGIEVLPSSAANTVSLAAGGHLFDDFVAHLSKGVTPLIGTASTLALTRLCLAARRSADERRPIELD